MTTTRETADHIGEAKEKVTANHAELAACPFCGGDPFDCGFRRWECGLCGAKGPAGRKNDATSGWNSRVGEAALLSEIAALRGQYELDGFTLQASVDRATQAERQRDEARDTIASTVAKADWMQGRLSGERSSIDRENIELVVSECRAYCHLQALANQGADQ